MYQQHTGRVAGVLLKQCAFVFKPSYVLASAAAGFCTFFVKQITFKERYSIIYRFLLKLSVDLSREVITLAACHP